MLRVREINENTRIIIKKEVSQSVVDCTLYSDKDCDYDGLNVLTFIKYSFSGSPLVAKNEIKVGMEDFKTVEGTGVSISNVRKDSSRGLLCDVHVSELLTIKRVPVKFVDMPLLMNLYSCSEYELDFLNHDIEKFCVKINDVLAPVIGTSNFKALHRKRLDVTYQNRCFSFDSVNYGEFCESIIMENNLDMRKLSDRLYLYAIRLGYWHIFDNYGYCYTSLTHKDFESITYSELINLRGKSNAYKTVSGKRAMVLDCRTKDILKAMTCYNNRWYISRKKLTNAEYQYLSRFLPASMFMHGDYDEIGDYLALAI